MIISYNISQSKLPDLEQVQLVRSPLVLAVDDQEDNLFLLSHSLEIFDCEFVGKTSSQAALEFVERHQPALILLDLLMPDMQGVELMQLLRQRQNVGDVPIIAITGLPALENRELVISAGFSDYLSKPYMLEELEQMVQHWGILPAKVS